jgi:hypothetical protein
MRGMRGMRGMRAERAWLSEKPAAKSNHQCGFRPLFLTRYLGRSFTWGRFWLDDDFGTLVIFPSLKI